ncbi:MAG: hypothetical protein ACKVPX_00280 [Myxococcaceae bacterium]
MRTFLVMVSALLAVSCQRDLSTHAPALVARTFNVSVDARALNDLPQECFLSEGLVVTSPQDAPTAMRWTLWTGERERVDMPPLRLWMGDAGTIDFPQHLERKGGQYVAEVSSQSAGKRPATRVELSLHEAGHGLEGTLRVTAAHPDVRCEVALKVTGLASSPRLVASR